MTPGHKPRAMKINNVFNFVVGIVFLVADAILITSFIIADEPAAAVWGLLIVHFGAMAYSSSQQGPYTASVVFVPAIVAFLDNVTEEWRSRYGWLLHLPAILVLVASLLAGLLL